jgi:hypothetical protein
MKIKFKQETWYSRMLSIIFLIGIYPLIAYLLGVQYADYVHELEKADFEALAIVSLEK